MNIYKTFKEQVNNTIKAQFGPETMKTTKKLYIMNYARVTAVIVFMNILKISGICCWKIPPIATIQTIYVSTTCVST